MHRHDSMSSPMIEKSLEHKEQLYISFVDLEGVQ